MLSKAQARTFFLGGTIVFSGIFLALTYDSMKQVGKLTHAENITDAVKRGKRVWEDNNCMGCHTLFGEGAYYAPELTKSVERRGKEFLTVFLKDPEKMYPGQRKMVNYHFKDEQIADVLAFLEWCGKVDLNGFPAKPPLQGVTQPAAAPSTPVAKRDVPKIFTEKTCLACHQLLGQGVANMQVPNAQGQIVPAPVLDEVYKRKSRSELVAWISDPQKVKPGTPMPTLVPGLVTPQEVETIVDFLISLGSATPAPVPTAPAPAVSTPN